MQQPFSIPVSPPDASDDESPVVTQRPSNTLRDIMVTVALLIAAPLVALMLTAFVFQSYEVDGPSMETTLQNTDRLIVWKAPHTVAKITGHPYVPHRFDVIIFIKRGLFEAGGSKEKQLVKRVIGLPGDRVVVNNGHILVYNKDHPDGYDPDINQEFSSNIGTLTTGNIDLVVPPDQVFVCGDNRTNSLDSRVFGPISSKDIVGKLVIRIFPVSNFKSFI